MCAAVVLLLTRLHGTASGSGGSDGWSYQYTFHTGELGSTRWLVVSAGLFLCGAAAFWVGRAKGLRVLAAGLSIMGVGVLAGALSAPGARRLSQEMYRRVPLGETQSSVTEATMPSMSRRPHASQKAWTTSIGESATRSSFSSVSPDGRRPF